MKNALGKMIVRLDGAAGSPSPGWSFAGSSPLLLLRCDEETFGATLTDAGGQELHAWFDPLEAMEWMATHIRQQENPRARWIGYLSYDLGRFFEETLEQNKDSGFPLFEFALVVPGDAKPISRSSQIPALSVTGNFSCDEYIRAVERVIEYIRAGDVFQVNLAQQFEASATADPAEIYARLIERSPAWYGAYLNFGDHALLCNSPELFIRIDPERRIITRPIKGTRPHGEGMEEELRDSIKDQAELNMIVDLERNDLGRICEIGSVRVTEPRAIEQHPTVYHGVSTVEGILRENVDFVRVLAAIFPGGSITGAPKIRAMQIIDELEPTPRGPYCGAIGYLSADGTVEFNIAIRTMLAKDGRVHIPVGGGIVADSNPMAEYEETLVKARAMFAALGIGEAEARGV